MRRACLPMRPSSDDAVTWQSAPMSTSGRRRSGSRCTSGLRSGCASTGTTPRALSALTCSGSASGQPVYGVSRRRKSGFPPSPKPASSSSESRSSRSSASSPPGSTSSGMPASTQRGAQLGDRALHADGLGRVVVTDVRGRGNSPDPVGDRRPCHVERVLERPRPVVEAREDVRVQVDQGSTRAAAAPGGHGIAGAPVLHEREELPRRQRL